MLRSCAPALLAFAALFSKPASAYAQDTGAWFGPDKRLHFEAAASLAVLGYAGACFATEDRRLRLATGLTLAIGAGVAKELWDGAGHGDASARDLTWDVVGAATGALIAGAVDWFVRRIASRPVAAER